MKNTVLITGSNGNLGTAVVQALHHEGCPICATVGSGPVPEQLANMTQEAVQVNLTDESAVNAFIDKTIMQHPDLNAAVLLVGGFAMGGFKDTDGAVIDKQITLNFKTAYHVVRPLIAHFDRIGGGHFVLVGARPALIPEVGKDMIAYALSKSLVLQLAEIINAYGKGKKISATVIIPSTIDTDANRKAMPDADFTKWVKADDIAETIAFILSDAGSTLRDTVIKLYNEA